MSTSNDCIWEQLTSMIQKENGYLPTRRCNNQSVRHDDLFSSTYVPTSPVTVTTEIVDQHNSSSKRRKTTFIQNTSVAKEVCQWMYKVSKSILKFNMVESLSKSDIHT